ncbi:MAG TPA: SWIM zinc finger family protein, partial [Hyphomonas sp.]|nr:SWIM zinc finger family protein [Hyphomonas sp.]
MPNFTEADIRARASAQSYSRGVSYQRDGAVLALAQRDNVITAEVSGSDYAPYDVEIHLDATGAIHSAGCSCPYEQGGYCKHIVAVLLAVLKNSDDIAVHPSVASLLAGLGEAELRQIVLTIAQAEPGFADAIEREVNLLRRTRAEAVTPAGGVPAPFVDAAAARRDLRRSFRLATQGGDRGHRHGYYDYDEGGYIDADAILQPHLAAARAFLAGGHPAAAAELLAAIVDEWGECVTDLEEWVYDASEESIGQAAESLDFLLAECLLSQPLSPAERRGWEKRLDAWAEGAMRLAITELALETWWDDPWLQAALQGQIAGPVSETAADDLAEEIEEDSEEDDEEDDEQYDVQVLTPVWLSILERAGRTHEFLNLALAAGEIVPYLLKLIAIGAVEQAVAAALARPLNAAASL